MRNKDTSAGNQQGTRLWRDTSETTSRAPSSGEFAAYLQGALHDATFSSNHRYRFSQKGTEWLKRLQAMLAKLGYRSWLYREGRNRSVWVLETLAKFLDFHFNPLRLRSSKERAAYIRGFFDAEGGMPRNRRERFYVQLVQNDRDKLGKIKALLRRLGVECGKIHNPSWRHPEHWRVFVRARSWPPFARAIGSWHPRKQRILERRMKI